MGLASKQLMRQLGQNRVFLALLFLLTALNSLSFFFVRFSVDGNLAALGRYAALSGNLRLYRDALESNTRLAYAFLAALTGLTVLAVVMFFYRFFRSGQRTMGCLRSLGFREAPLCGLFTAYTGVLSICGACAGLFGGYFLSGILLDANERTYSVTGLVRQVHGFSLLIGIGVPSLASSLAALSCFSFVRGKEAAVLIAGQPCCPLPASRRIADKIARALPFREKAPLRMALQKPTALLLILTAVMAFDVCLILGCSLNLSSRKVLDMQTDGHHYEYETAFPGYRMGDATTREQRMEALERNAVSNQVSAAINQVTGAIVGSILIFLALYINFQDSARDILILHLAGYRRKEIRKMLIDIYLPVVWAAFLLTLAPSVWLARSIQRSLSIAIGDYMPFSTSPWIILAAFALLSAIYWAVQGSFAWGIRWVIKKEDLTRYAAFE